MWNSNAKTASFWHIFHQCYASRTKWFWWLTALLSSRLTGIECHPLYNQTHGESSRRRCSAPCGCCDKCPNSQLKGNAFHTTKPSEIKAYLLVILQLGLRREIPPTHVAAVLAVVTAMCVQVVGRLEPLAAQPTPKTTLMENKKNI